MLFRSAAWKITRDNDMNVYDVCNGTWLKIVSSGGEIVCDHVNRLKILSSGGEIVCDHVNCLKILSSGGETVSAV